MSQSITLASDDQGVATITLNRPEIHNAFDDVFIQEFSKILQQISLNTNIKIVLLKAIGKSFSAGADLNWMRRMINYSYEENVKDAMALSDLLHTLKFLNKPTIACVQGPAFGGGVGLVACCDIAIASTRANFCFSEVKLGLIPAIISPYVISAIGERAANQYFLTADIFDAIEAHRLGLISQFTTSEQLDSAVQTTIAQLLKNSPQALKATKELIHRVAKDPFSSENNLKNAAAIATLRVSKEGQEGLSAFLEKRTPDWIKISK